MKLIKYFILFLFLSIPLFADRGSIPFIPDIKIFEPTQRAMIAWNGEEEILLLTTDIRASDSTEVLEVLPLPYEPVVKKGDIETFKKAIRLINDRILLQQILYRKKTYQSDFNPSIKPVVNPF